MNYALLLHNKTTTLWPSFEPRFVIDTGRNGQVSGAGPLRIPLMYL
jgi:hypothetical protein